MSIPIVFAMTGSLCTLSKAIDAMRTLREQGFLIRPVISYAVQQLDSRFGKAADWRMRIAEAAGVNTEEIIDSIPGAEPIGPKKLAELVIIAPCTGNTIAKLAHGITDTPVLMAAKSQLRTERPLLLAISTNDGLAANATNIGRLLNTKHIYFVPFGQDDATAKPRSLCSSLSLLPESARLALNQQQIQPVLLGLDKRDIIT